MTGNALNRQKKPKCSTARQQAYCQGCMRQVCNVWILCLKSRMLISWHFPFSFPPPKKSKELVLVCGVELYHRDESVARRFMTIKFPFSIRQKQQSSQPLLSSASQLDASDRTDSPSAGPQHQFSVPMNAQIVGMQGGQQQIIFTPAMIQQAAGGLHELPICRFR